MKDNCEKLLCVMDFVPNKKGSLCKFLIRMAESLRAKGSRTYFIFSGTPVEWFRDEMTTCGAEFRVVDGSPGNLKNLLSVIRIALEIRPTVLTFWFLPLFSARTILMAATIPCRKKIFVDRTSVDVHEKRGFLRLLSKIRGKIVSCLYDTILSVSEFNRRRNVERSFIDKSKTRVVYNGILNDGLPGHSAESSIAGKRYFLFAGQLITEKGIYTLIEAFRKVIAEFRGGENVILVIAGEGQESGRISDLIRSAGCSDTIKLIGGRNDVPALMATAMAIVVPSEWPEAFGFVTAEALESGRPLVVSNAGALPEVVDDCALIFRKRDVDDLAAQLRYILMHGNQAALAAMCEKAVQRAKFLFSIDRMVSEYVGLFLASTDAVDAALVRGAACPEPLARKSICRTLFICNLVPSKTGAFECLLEELGNTFMRKGDELILAVAGPPIPVVAAAWRRTGLELEISSGWTDSEGEEHGWAFCLPALRLVRKYRPDVVAVHFGNELPALVVSIIARVFVPGRTVWVWQQDQQIRSPRFLTRHFSKLRLLSMFGWHFLAVYDGGRESMLKRGIPSERVTTIHSGVKSPATVRGKGWLRNTFRIPADSVICICVASLIPRKRLDFLIKAFAMLKTNEKRSVSAPVLLIVGEGPERANLASLAESLCVSQRILFLGLRQDVTELLHESNVYVHTSLAETCTYAILESMAAGIPAVVTEAGAAREQIVSGQTGYVVSTDDLDGLVICLDRLMHDGDARIRMGAAAKERWTAMYRVEISAGKCHDLYKRLWKQSKCRI